MSLISLGEQDDIGLPETAAADAENEGNTPSCKRQADATKEAHEQNAAMRGAAAKAAGFTASISPSAEIASRPARPRAFG